MDSKINELIKFRLLEAKGQRYLKLYYNQFWLVKEMGNHFALFLYMNDYITRYSGSGYWWNENVLPYYEEHHLPFGQHQRSIADKMNIGQATVSRGLSLLTELKVIQFLGKETWSDKSAIAIYSLGQWDQDRNGNRIEALYFDILTPEISLFKNA